MPRGIYERKHIPPPEVRFWAKVEKTERCWTWKAARNGKYGAFGVTRHDIRPAHRYAYQISKGPIPPGLTVDHLCLNPLCVRPDHLEAVTLKENIRRSNSPSAVIFRSGKCARGHERTPENTYFPPGGWARQCITCRDIVRSTPEAKARAAARTRAYRAKRKRLATAGS